MSLLRLLTQITEIKSKRVRTAHKHRILSRIKDHHRKERRAAKKNPGKINSESFFLYSSSMYTHILNSLSAETKKDPGIPNEWPFKEELLNEIEAQKNEVSVERYGLGLYQVTDCLILD